MEIWCFLFVTWPRHWSVVWLCGRGVLILNHHPAKFGVRRPCESGDIKVFFNCHVTMCLKYHVTLLVWGYLNLSYHPVKFRVHKPYESRYITWLCVVPSFLQLQFWFQCWGSSAEVYKWPPMTVLLNQWKNKCAYVKTYSNNIDYYRSSHKKCSHDLW